MRATINSGMSRRQIAHALDLTLAQVQAIEDKALYKLQVQRKAVVPLRKMRDLAIEARRLRDMRIGNQPFSDIDAELEEK